jgi:hypothetical protein
MDKKSLTERDICNKGRAILRAKQAQLAQALVVQALAA